MPLSGLWAVRFDFKKQALLYVPGHLPAPAPNPAYTERLWWRKS